MWLTTDWISIQLCGLIRSLNAKVEKCSSSSRCGKATFLDIYFEKQVTVDDSSFAGDFKEQEKRVLFYFHFFFFLFLHCLLTQLPHFSATTLARIKIGILLEICAFQLVRGAVSNFWNTKTLFLTTPCICSDNTAFRPVPEIHAHLRSETTIFTIAGDCFRFVFASKCVRGEVNGRIAIKASRLSKNKSEFNGLPKGSINGPALGQI